MAFEKYSSLKINNNNNITVFATDLTYIKPSYACLMFNSNLLKSIRSLLINVDKHGSL